MGYIVLDHKDTNKINTILLSTEIKCLEKVFILIISKLKGLFQFALHLYKKK